MKCKNCNEKEAVKYSKYSNGEFCSRKCARGFSTKAKRKEINKKVSDVLKQKYENGSITLPNSDSRTLESRKRQGNNCSKTYAEKKKKQKKDLPFEKWKKRWIYEFVFEEIGNHCEECGYEYTDENGRGPYEIHHKDGDHNNWKRENLEVLCLNCHWKTPNWRFRGKKQTYKSIEKMLKTSLENGVIKKINVKKYKHLNGVVA